MTSCPGEVVPQSEFNVRVYEDPDVDLGDWFGRRWLDARRLEADGPSGSSYLIAWSDGAPVGHANVRWDGAPDDAWHSRLACPYLNGLGAGPKGRGIGSALIAAAEDLARSRGASELGLGVEDEGQARALYERLGYVDWGGGVIESQGPVGFDTGGVAILGVERLTFMSKKLK